MPWPRRPRHRWRARRRGNDTVAGRSIQSLDVIRIIVGTIFVGFVGAVIVVLGLAELIVPKWFITPQDVPRRWWTNWRHRSLMTIRFSGACGVALGAIFLMHAFGLME